MSDDKVGQNSSWGEIDSALRDDCKQLATYGFERLGLDMRMKLVYQMAAHCLEVMTLITAKLTKEENKNRI